MQIFPSGANFLGSFCRTRTQDWKLVLCVRDNWESETFCSKANYKSLAIIWNLSKGNWKKSSYFQYLFVMLSVALKVKIRIFTNIHLNCLTIVILILNCKYVKSLVYYLCKIRQFWTYKHIKIAILRDCSRIPLCS